MKLRYWILDAKSGVMVDEVTVDGSPKLSSQLGGGTCSLPVSLRHLTLEDGESIDAAAVQRTISLIDGGRRSLVVTDERKRILGATEWLLMRRSRSTTAGVMTVEGMEWDGYPSLRSLNANYAYTDTEQLQVANVLLRAAFQSFNAGMTITIPWQSSGVTRSLDYKSHSAYYSDLLDEISAPDDGFEWCVEVTPVWNGDELASVNRTVVFGHPTLSRASGLVIDQDSPGGNRGNAVSISGGDDFSRYAQSVYGIGAGSGDKQRWVGLSDPTLTNAGYLNSTKNVSFPGVTDIGTLTALTRGELVRSQDLRDPFSATAFVDQLAAMPKKGTLVRLQSAPTWGYPVGLDVALRIGEVSFAADGNFCMTASVLAA